MITIERLTAKFVQQWLSQGLTGRRCKAWWGRSTHRLKAWRPSLHRLPSCSYVLRHSCMEAQAAVWAFVGGTMQSTAQRRTHAHVQYSTSPVATFTAPMLVGGGDVGAPEGIGGGRSPGRIGGPALGKGAAPWAARTAPKGGLISACPLATGGARAGGPLGPPWKPRGL